MVVKTKLTKKSKLAVTKSRYIESAANVSLRDYDVGILCRVEKLCRDLANDASGLYLKEKLAECDHTRLTDIQAQMEQMSRRKVHEEDLNVIVRMLFPEVNDLFEAQEQLTKALA